MDNQEQFHLQRKEDADDAVLKALVFIFLGDARTC
jgi:hypothetical protein